jgi:nitric oxide reductase NorE protein
MTMFAAFFVLYCQAHAREPELFLRSQQRLDPGFGLANTVFLLGSSYLVAIGVRATRSGSAQAPRWFTWAMLCGGAFGVDKVIEYSEKAAAGITPLTNNFFMYYFVLTGIHAAHLLIGMCVLAYLRRATARKIYRPSQTIIECCASYWHLVDVLWIVLFPLLYLLK